MFIDKPGVSATTTPVNLLDRANTDAPSKTARLHEGRDRETDNVKWTATPVDFVFGSTMQSCELYAQSNGNDRFHRDFVETWAKATILDRLDLANE